MNDNMRPVVKLTLEACRKNAGLTLREASKYFGINYQTLSKYENDSTNLPFKLISNMSEVYRIPVNNIFLGKKSEHTRNMKAYRDSLSRKVMLNVTE